jgi:hypothetical protein
VEFLIDDSTVSKAGGGGVPTATVVYDYPGEQNDQPGEAK